jgi:uncharacterized protein YggU (UPF0235/DUF167 family)
MNSKMTTVLAEALGLSMIVIASGAKQSQKLGLL